MLIIGLTGGIACGKTDGGGVRLRALGAPVFDADAVSRAVTSAGRRGAAATCARASATCSHPDGH